MSNGSSSESGLRPGSDPQDNENIERFVPKRDHDPRDLRSWAKRTGFVSTFSTEFKTINSRFNFRNQRNNNNNDSNGDNNNVIDEKTTSLSHKIELDHVLGTTRAPHDGEIGPSCGNSLGNSENGDKNDGRGVGPIGNGNEAGGRNVVVESKNDGRGVGPIGNGNGNGNGGGGRNDVVVETKNVEQVDEGVDLGFGKSPDLEEPILGRMSPRSFDVKCGVLDNPGFALVIYYGFQHYLSLAGSLVLMPLITVPAMGGTDRDTADVISTMLMVSGITTILHSFFGTRLPLVQGSSFVYLAPALVIMNSQELRNLTEHKFRYIMRELQGAIIIGSLFQTMLGFSGLMSLLVRLVNPVVVAPTMSAVGLAFFSYGFPQAGSCVEISLPLILLILIFTLYIRGISFSGHRVFQIYAVPLSIVIVWVYAFFLTASGAYNFKGCSPNIPSSNILIDECIKHASTMKYCRTDVSDAWRTSAWIRIPYPLQWGIPIFRLRTSIIMIIVSLVSSVDSVGTYYSASLRVNSKPPTRGIVSRGIGMEGFCSLLAGLWGTGTGSTTLTENGHTINITKVANRRAVQVGAVLLVFFSLIGKVGGILASIPLALAASVLCFVWALIIALGLLHMQYTQASRFRNLGIVGVSLFLGLSIPAYFQQFEPLISLILPSYLIPYASASSGPFHTGNAQLDFAINGLFSMNMVVTFLIAFILDNTVPGSNAERGVYKWSTFEDLATDPSSLASYSLPSRVASVCCCSRCLGL